MNILKSLGVKVFIPFCIIAALFSSCKMREVKETINGQWCIDTIYYKNMNIFYCIGGNNVFEFHEDGGCILPITLNHCNWFKINDENGNWDIQMKDNSSLILDIKTKNTIFSGKFKVTFRKDEEKRLLKMEIKSDSLYMSCTKWLYNYNTHTKLINDLVNLSQNQ